MKVIYQGISEAEQKKAIIEHMALADPPEKIAQELFYHVADKDGALMARQKEKRTAEWLAKVEKEKVEEMAQADACRELRGIKFPKGEVVDVSDDNDLVTHVAVIDGQRKKVQGKMFFLVESGVFKLAEEDSSSPAMTPEVGNLLTEGEVIAEESKRRPGRPRKG